MNGPVRQRSRLGLLAAACIFMAVSIGIVLGAQRLIADAGSVAHSHLVIGTIDELEARLRDAEAAQRGYLLTGDANYLAYYQIARRTLPQLRDRLFGLVHDNPEQEVRARTLWTAIDKRLGQMVQTLARYRDSGLPAAQASINQEVMASSTTIRQMTAVMKEAERTLLAQHAASSRESADLLRGLALLGIPIGLLVILAVYRLLVQEIRHRAHAEGESVRANDQLRIGLDRVERGRAELQALNHFGSMLQSCSSAEEALQLARRLLGGLLPGVSGRIYRIRNSQDHAELSAAWGNPALAAPEMMPVDACWALRRGQSHSTSATHAARCPHLGAGEEDADETLCVPLIAQGTPLGLLTLAGADEAVNAHFDVIQTAVEQLSMALANLSLQDRLRQQSIRDPLSGLFNRRYLEESAARELGRCVRRGLPLSLLMFDIDHFKDFNDVHGHAGGDAVLAHFGSLLQSMTRGEDIACRYGGEEFTLILPEADVEAASARAEEIRLAVAAMQVPHLGKRLPQVTVSIGVAGYPAHGNTPEALMKAADEALYRAKRAGRNRVDVAIGM